MHNISPSYTSFAGHRRIASGPLLTNVLSVRQALAESLQEPVLVFDDATGQVIDVDTRGTETDIIARLAAIAPTPAGTSTAPGSIADATESRGRGRPRLGVVSREVTLLPRHWEWLTAQPGGASVAIRKLVEEARRAGSVRERQRQAQERAYRFMAAMAGDLPGFEEAARALFAGDNMRMSELTTAWPPDVREYALKLAHYDKDAAA